MTTTETSCYLVHPLPADVLDRARGNGSDGSDGSDGPDDASDTGSSAATVERLTATGGEPLRCCLRDARPGEELLLFGYAPPAARGPYREVGPVFAHAEPCAGYTGDGYPADWTSRPQVLRAYDDRGWIHPATRVHDGSDPPGAIADVLAQDGVVEVHSRNVAYGCYMFAVTRR